MVYTQTDWRTATPTQIRRIVRRYTTIQTIHAVSEIKIRRGKPDQVGELETIDFGSNWFWSVVWPAGQALARYMLDTQIVKGKTVLDFGAGSGFSSIAASKAGASRITAVDTNPVAREAIYINSKLNDIKNIEIVEKIDPRQKWDVILAGDIFYDHRAEEFLLEFLGNKITEGSIVLLATLRSYLAPEKMNLKKIRVYKNLDSPYNNNKHDRVKADILQWIPGKCRKKFDIHLNNY